MPIQWIYAIVGLLIGTIVGVMISRLTAPQYKTQKALQKELEETKYALEQQRQELSDHFAQSAEMLDSIGKDYTKLYQHMAKTSSTLIPNMPEQDNPFAKQIALQSSSDAEAPSDDNLIDTAPKDYAKGASGLLTIKEKEIVNSDEAVNSKSS